MDNADIYRFIRELIALRREHPTLTADYRLGSKDYEETLEDGVTFHGVKANQPDWSYLSHSLAMHLHGVAGDVGFYVIANAYWKALEFELPAGVRWKRLVDTNLDPPEDLSAEDQSPLLTRPTYGAGPRSVVVLVEAR